ncbi:unnamed protein product [Microthlaspi erraticum]|uniref:Uncharacterized protein n=1 Tax=Microthlaspi erraticum TaxID=1685480 RepID=A0A6D2KAE2_9BRAS|nr:unnamed protein product [Microthlaspi erraticum]
MEVMEIAGKYPLRAPITLALEMEFIGVGWISLGNDPMASKAKFGGANSSSIELGVKTRKVVFWSILEHMGREEHGGLGMDSSTHAKEKKEAILKTSSTIYSTNRSSSSTRPAKLQLDRAEKSKSNPKNVASPLTSFDPKPNPLCI